MEREPGTDGTATGHSGASHTVDDTDTLPPPTILELDDLFDTLGHVHRRYLVYRLAAGRSEATLGELATEIAAWRDEKGPDAVTPDERERILVSLHHFHLPVLQRLGVVEYDEATDLVRARDVDWVQPVLQRATTLGTERSPGPALPRDDLTG